MAVIKFGIIVTEALGKIGGVIFSRNKSGAYVKKNTKPINPQTALQETIRTIFSLLVNAWREVLTETQRSEWAVYAANVSVKNKLGDDIFITGMNHYLRSNTPRLQAGLTRIDDGPADFALAGLSTLVGTTVSEATQLISVAFDDTEAWANEDDAAMIIYAGIPKNDTVNFFDGPWRYADVIEGDSITPPTSPTTMACPYPVVEGQVEFVYGRISLADGRLSEKFRIRNGVGA